MRVLVHTQMNRQANSNIFNTSCTYFKINNNKKKASQCLSAGLIKAAFDVIRPMGALTFLCSIYLLFKLHAPERISNLQKQSAKA